MDKIKQLIDAGEITIDDIEAYLESINKTIVNTAEYDSLIMMSINHPG